jgi:hypothetical protein
MRAAALTALLLAFAGVVGGARLLDSSGAASAAGGAPAACLAPPAGVTWNAAQRVVRRFVEDAVQRRDVRCSFELAAPALRMGMSRAEWTSSAPVDPFVSATPRRVSWVTSVRVVLPDQIGAWVFLEAPDIGRQVYEIVLVRSAGRWLVDYWGATLDPTADFPAPAGSA